MSSYKRNRNVRFGRVQAGAQYDQKTTDGTERIAEGASDGIGEAGEIKRKGSFDRTEGPAEETFLLRVDNNQESA
jgi:hypothetical protein